MYRVVCLLVLVSRSHQVILQGECNDAAIGGYVTDLNITRMFGTWYQIARIDNGVEVGECSSISFEGKYDSSGNLVSVEATHTEFVNGTGISHNGTVESFQDIPIDGIYYMNLTDFLVGNFVVQATNYTGFAILYSCEKISNSFKSVAAWHYHRTAALSTAEDNSIKDIININPDLKSLNWTKVLHDNKSCGKNGGVTIIVPHVLVVLTAMFLSKDSF